MLVLILKILRGFIKLVTEGDSPHQLALGFGLGSLIGLAPFNVIYYLIVSFFVFCLRVNISACFFAVFVFGLLSYLSNSLANSIGIYFLVDTQSVVPFLSIAYEFPVIPLMQLNNTLMLGSVVLSLLLFVPIYILTKNFING